MKLIFLKNLNTFVIRGNVCGSWTVHYSVKRAVILEGECSENGCLRLKMGIGDYRYESYRYTANRIV